MFGSQILHCFMFIYIFPVATGMSSFLLCLSIINFVYFLSKSPTRSFSFQSAYSVLVFNEGSMNPCFSLWHQNETGRNRPNRNMNSARRYQFPRRQPLRYPPIPMNIFKQRGNKSNSFVLLSTPLSSSPPGYINDKKFDLRRFKGFLTHMLAKPTKNLKLIFFFFLLLLLFLAAISLQDYGGSRLFTTFSPVQLK